MIRLFAKYSKYRKTVILAIMFVVSLFSLGLYPILKAQAAAPAAPTELAITQHATLPQLNLTWRDNATDEGYFVLDRSTAGPNGPWQTNYRTLSMNATSFSDTGLQYNQNYCYRVSAVGSGGTSAFSNTACKTVLDNSPVWVGKAYGMGGAYKVTISGNYAYVTSSIGLQIVDITNLSNPLILGTLELQSAYAVAIGETGKVFVSDSNTIKVVDVTNKFAPQIIGSVQLPDYVSGLSYANATLYAADYEAGLVIINPLPATAPTITRTIDTPGQAKAVAISGNYAYVADGTLRLQVVNLTSNSVVGSLSFSDGAWDITIRDSYAYLATGTAGLAVVDISNPASPTQIASKPVKDQATGLTVVGNYAYIASASTMFPYNGLQIFNVSVPSTPVESSFTQIIGQTLGGLAVRNGQALFAAGNGGLVTLNVQDANTPQIIFVLSRVQHTGGVAVSGNYLYAIKSDGFGSNVYVFNISNPSSPLHLRTFSLSGRNYFGMRITVKDNFAYVGDDGVLKIFNVANPADPTLVSSYDTSQYIYGQIKVGNLLYVANDRAGLAIFDVSNPALPQPVRTIDTPGQAIGLAVSGNTALIADGTSGIQIINLSTNSIVGSLDLPGIVYDVRLDAANHYAYLAAGYQGLAIVDVSNFEIPTLIKTLPTRDEARGVALTNNKAIVAYSYRNKGVLIADISNPPEAYQLWDLGSPGLDTRQVEVFSDYAYVTDDKFLVDILSLNGPIREPQISKSADKTTVQPGDTITYSLTAANPSSDTFTALSLSDPIPAGTTYLTGQSTKPSTCAIDESHTNDATNPRLIFTCPSIAPDGQTGDTLNFTFKVRVE